MSAIRWPDLSAYDIELRIRETSSSRDLVALTKGGIRPEFKTLLDRLGFSLDEQDTWCRDLNINLRDLMSTFPVASLVETEYESLLVSSFGVAEVPDATETAATDVVGDAETPDTAPVEDPDGFDDSAGDANHDDGREEKDDDGATSRSSRIEDFGEHIGGAKKERWSRTRGVRIENVETWTPEEKATLVTKDRVWPIPDWRKQLDRGADRGVLARIKAIRDAVLPGPGSMRHGYRAGSRRRSTFFEPDIEKTDDYVRCVGELADALRGVKTVAHLRECLERYVTVTKYENEWSRGTRCRSSDKMEALRQHLTRKARFMPLDLFTVREDCRDILNEADNAEGKGWPAARSSKRITKAVAAEDENEQSKKKKDKKSFSERPHLSSIERSGNPLTLDRDVTPDDFLRVFGFRGGEFGNWLSNKERQEVLNLGYHAFLDLAAIMDLPPKAMSLNGTLAIAFGARGSGRALAHYEPGRRVINLTRLKGAGALAHEWAHALDHYLGTHTEASSQVTVFRPYASTATRKVGDPVASAMLDVMKAIAGREANDDDAIAWVKRNVADRLFESSVAIALDDCVRDCTIALHDEDGSSENKLSAANVMASMSPFIDVIRRWRAYPGGVSLSEMTDGAKSVVDALQACGEVQSEYFSRTVRSLNLSRTSWLVRSLNHFLCNTPSEQEMRRFLDSNQAEAIKMEMAAADRGYASLMAERGVSHGKGITNTDYLIHAREIDGDKKAERNPYWSSKWELFARAFESWVQDEIKSRGWCSQYLVHGTEARSAPSPYPIGEDRSRIHHAIGAFRTALSASLRGIDAGHAEENEAVPHAAARMGPGV